MKIKICACCKEEKDANEFCWRNKSKGTRHTRCKECSRASNRKHYKENKQYYFNRNARARKEIREFVWKYKDVPCADCGVSYPHYVMDFHHVLGEKEAEISRMIKRNVSKEKMVNEISKCVVLCSNCHREREHGNK